MYYVNFLLLYFFFWKANFSLERFHYSYFEKLKKKKKIQHMFLGKVPFEQAKLQGKNKLSFFRKKGFLKDAII